MSAHTGHGYRYRYTAVMPETAWLPRRPPRERARKHKARAERDAAAAANRAAHGVSKPQRKLERARRAKDDKRIDAHKLDDET